MERGDSRARSMSFVTNSSSMWRNSGRDVFSRSSRRDDDEEALKWAAIQRLPTYARLRKGLVTGTGGEIYDIEIPEIGFQEKKHLVDRLVKMPEKDNEQFLLKLRGRIDSVGIEIPTVEVRFEQVNVVGEAYVGTRGLPSFVNFCANVLEGLLTSLHIIPSQKKRFSILHDVSGIIKPRRMTLLLGPPGSGKTTLLQALAGKLDPDLELSGKISYNGHDMHEFVPQRTSAYIDQHDIHLAEMTVRETLAFSARCQGVGFRYEMLAELSRREKAAHIKPDPDIDSFMKAVAAEGQEANVIVDYILKVLGLEACADTFIGNQMIRGISGGQRKRVTTGEILVGPANVLLMDEISTGLDSSTTFQTAKALKHYVHILNGTALISLLQPAPEAYNLFDDIILLSDGHIVYEGPREHVLEFFESLGFVCPQRKEVADFLQEVTSRKDQVNYWASREKPYSFVTSEEFARAFKSFHVWKRLGDELGTPYPKNKSHPAALTNKKYGVPKKELLKACFTREVLLWKRNFFLQGFNLGWVVFIGLILMSLYPKTKMHKSSVIDGQIFMGCMFMTLSIFLFLAYPELTTIIDRLPLLYKQRNLLFYPPWAYSLSSWSVKIPMSLIEASAWAFSTYYAIGYDPYVGRLFKQLLLLFVFRQMASGLFTCVGALGRNMTISMTFGAFAMLVLFVLGGFVLSRDSIKKWWKWAYWVSPLMYGQSAIATNEFLGNSWGQVLPSSTETLGLMILKSRGFFTRAYWYWLGVGALVVFTFVFNGVLALALTYLQPLKEGQLYKSEETSDIANDPTTRNTILLSSRDDRNGIGTKGAFSSLSTEISSRDMKRIGGMVLPFEKYSITFDEIRYSVDMPQELKNQGVTENRLELLKGVSGAFRPGVLTALMGVSGAGKTTLMDVLAGRKTGGYIEGNIMVSGYAKKQETFARISGYCEQNDIHSPHVTVHESLTFSAWLRLPREINAEMRKAFIEEVMELVELTPLREALVGLPGVNGLSTEQRKRLTIAVELVANPSIIFMDEPTTGLDARAAAIVMRTVRNIVDTGRTIVCTIHQPSIDIFEAFDELFLMAQGGEEIYVGPLGHCSCHLINYFEGIGGISKIKQGYNPGTWMLEVTSKEQEEILGIRFADVYKSSDLYRRNKEMITELSRTLPGSKDIYFAAQFSQSFFIQWKACLWKQHCSYWRNTSYTTVRFLSTTFIALIFGSIFWDLGSKRKSQQDVLNAIGSLYTAVLFIGFQNASSVQPVVDVERTVFYREKAAGMYSPLAYAFAQAVIELPYTLVQTLAYALIVYSMIGFDWTAAKFFWYIYFMYFTFLYFTFSGMMLLALSPNQMIASLLCAALVGIWNIFSGFSIPRIRAPGWWRWYFWLNPFAWTLYGGIASQFGDIKNQLEFIVTVEEFIKIYFGYRHDYVRVAAAVVAGFVLLFASLYALSLKVFNFQKR